MGSHQRQVAFFFQTFVDPSLTAYEAETQKMMSAKEDKQETPESANQILEIIETFKDQEHHDRSATVVLVLHVSCLSGVMLNRCNMWQQTNNKLDPMEYVLTVSNTEFL